MAWSRLHGAFGRFNSNHTLCMFAGFGNTIALPQRTAVRKHAADISSLEIEAMTKRSRLKLDSVCLSEDTRPQLRTPLPEGVLDDIFPDTLLDDAEPMCDGASPRPMDNKNPDFVVPVADALIDSDCTDTEIEESRRQEVQGSDFVVPAADTLIDSDCTDAEIEEDFAQARVCGCGFM